MEKSSQRNKTVRMAQLSLLSAISVILMWLVHIPLIPVISFMKYDPADIPILWGTLLFGPGAGFLMTVTVSIIQGTLVEGGVFDAIMHILATGTLVLLSGAYYKKVKSLKGAAVGLLLGTLGMTLVMGLANLLITPIYLGIDHGAVIHLLPYIILFNLLKAGINSLIVLLLYKKMGYLLKT